MTTASPLSVNLPVADKPRDRRVQVEQDFAKLLAAASIRGFHGTASICVTLQDGHIQNWRIGTERMQR